MLLCMTISEFADPGSDKLGVRLADVNSRGVSAARKPARERRPEDRRPRIEMQQRSAVDRKPRIVFLRSLSDTKWS
jgi:hypothetical protein